LALALTIQNVPQKDILVLGELNLDGTLRPAKSVFVAMQMAIENGIKHAIIAKGSDTPPKEINAVYVGNIREAVDAMENIEISQDLKEYSTENSDGVENSDEVIFSELEENESLDDIFLSDYSEDTALAVIATVAGKHNLLLWGGMNCGKSFVATEMKKIIPLPTSEEFQGIERLYSLSGFHGLCSKPFTPFRMPHQTATIEGIFGGGTNLRCGEISLAHNGVLFLDEASEFRTSVLQMLRVPLENGQITLSRAGRTATYPSKFQLVLTVNRCPCGSDKICFCSPNAVKQYWQKVTNPLLDSFPIRIEVNKPSENEKSKLTIRRARELVANAIKIQRERGFYNGQVKFSYGKVAESVNYDKLLPSNWTVKAKSNALSVARTLADMESYEDIDHDHINKACELRQKVPSEY